MNRRNFLAGIGAAVTAAILPGKQNDVYANPVTLGEMPEKVDFVQEDFGIVIDCEGRTTKEMYEHIQHVLRKQIDEDIEKMYYGAFSAPSKRTLSVQLNPDFHQGLEVGDKISVRSCANHHDNGMYVVTEIKDRDTLSVKSVHEDDVDPSDFPLTEERLTATQKKLNEEDDYFFPSWMRSVPQGVVKFDEFLS